MSVTKNKVLFSMALKTVTTAVFVLENLKCQQRPLKPVKSALYTTKFLFIQSWVPSIQQNWNLEEELYYFAAKNGWKAGPIWSWPKKMPHPSF